MPVSTINPSSISALGYGFKNRIINGAMVIDQRNAGASVTSGYPVDRWRPDTTAQSSFSYQQNAGSVTPPTGFVNYLGCTSTAAYSPGSNTTVRIAQTVEGFNVADLAWGTANAQTATLSFWVRSSLTGTHSGSAVNSSGTRSYVYSFTISSANTWEYKTIVIPGDTTGTWLTNNGIGLIIGFNLGTGTGTYGTTTAGTWQSGNLVGLTNAVQVSATNGATFYITGVQLERGVVATAFDYRPYGTELALCQRYYEKSYDTGTVPGAATANGMMLFPTADQATNQFVGASQTYRVEKRATATMSFWDIAGNASRSSLYTAGGLVRTDNNNNVSTVVGTTGGIYIIVSTAAGNFPALQWVASAEL